MKEMLKDKIFWIFSLAIAGVIFVAAMDSNRTYQAEMNILFVPKNEIVARNADQVLENARQISKMLSFYDKIVEENQDIQDGAAELPDAKRKAFWNSTMKAEKIRKSGIVKIVITNDSQSQASIISRQSAESLTVAMSRFYDIRKELDMRIVDGPIVKEVEKMNVFSWLLISLFLGLVLGAIFNVAIESLVKRYGTRKRIEKIEIKARPAIFPRFSLPETMKRDIFPKAKDIFDFKAEKEAALVQGKKTGLSTAGVKKAAAPDNLPIAEDFNFNVVEPVEEDPDQAENVSDENLSLEQDAPIGVEKKEEEKDFFKEATPEEVKARLNKLLSGDMLK